MFRFLLIMAATFLTCSLYFIAALTAVKAVTAKVKSNDRSRPR
jgi:hypothetical protein